MEVVTIKTKFQIVIPQRIREQVQVDIGDILRLVSRTERSLSRQRA